ncbi:FlmA family RiPP peptide [Pedobacter lusitanus]|uniref:hypothetical protein n=1 Tax=Pedobacter lusitanus TaxID=1503925 RepID=UPI000A80D49A|nr:hypothetical protein [Pedobacter lusitanus]
MNKKNLIEESLVKELVKPRLVEEIYANSKVVESLCRSRNGACRNNNTIEEPIDEELIF